jgi:hypothetical protein
MIGDSIGAAVGAEKRRKEAAAESRRAREDRERGLAMATDAEYDPFLVRDMIGPYQRSQSPVARGYLESFLTGVSPQAVQSTRATAPTQRAQAQGSFDQAYGGWDALRSKQREMEASTPWETKPLAREPVTDEMRWTAKLGQGGRTAMQRLGLGYDDLATLERAGISVDARKGELDGLSKAADKEVKAINKAIKAGDYGLLERFLESKRGGDRNANLAQQLRGGR